MPRCPLEWFQDGGQYTSTAGQLQHSGSAHADEDSGICVKVELAEEGSDKVGRR